jgi:GxxExxY protein
MHGTHGNAKSGRHLLHGGLTEKILATFFQVHYELGHGFAESVYSAAMACALSDAGLDTRREVPTIVHFRGREVGLFRADHIVESRVLLELKAGAVVPEGATSQVLNLLRATNIEVALLLHFGLKPRFERLVYTNDRKILSVDSV